MSGLAEIHSVLNQHPCRLNYCLNQCPGCMFQPGKESGWSPLLYRHNIQGKRWSERIGLIGSHNAQDLRADMQNCCSMLCLDCMNLPDKLFGWLKRYYRHNAPERRQYRMIVQNSVGRFQFHIQFVRWHFLYLRNVLVRHHHKTIERLKTDIARLCTILDWLRLLLERSGQHQSQCNLLDLCLADRCRHRIEVG